MSEGEERELWLQVGGLNENLKAVETVLNYNPGYFEIAEVKEGPYLSQNNTATSFFYTIDSVNGILTIQAERLDETVSPGFGGTLATVRIKAKNSVPESTIDFTSSELRTTGDILLQHKTAGTVINVNSPPIFDNLPATVTIQAGSSLSHVIAASDSDGDDLTYYLMGEIPQGLTINSSTGMVTWDVTVAGTYDIIVAADDGLNELATSILTIIVTQPPTVTGTDPADGATGININKSITATFSEHIYPADSFNEITLNTNGTVVSADMRISDILLIIEPLEPLVSNKHYTVTIPAGSVKNITGEQLESTYNFSFTTGEKPVAVITMSPQSGITTSTVITWGYEESYDPNSFDIVAAEWEGKQDIYPEEGEYTVRLRVQNEYGTWSEWVETTFNVTASVGVRELVVGNVQSFAVMNDKTLKIWGLNSRGQLGLGDLEERILPEDVGYITNIKQVAGGNSHSLILLKDGTVYASGRNDFGQLGLGDNDDRMHFVQIPGLADIIQIAIGGDFSLALTENGEVFSWGYNADGQLGLGNTTNQNIPSLITGLSNVIQVEAGQQHSLALTNTEVVYSWGQNFHGQLGLGNTKDRVVPTLITGLSGVKQIAADGFHSMALLNDGTVMSWGRNFFGQLGLGNTRRYTSPTLIPGLNNVIHLEASVDSSYSLHADGTVRAWGRNDDGQLGLGDTSQRNSPTLITAIEGVKQISAGGWHTMAILEDGTPMVWGWNYYGQLGLGDKESRLVPTVITSLTN
ncbi:MAG: Ig-like domain-containing protein [Clostridiales bacterium]|nr:Ig-like domain-containing protein [Clostridiales bacterium]